MQESGIYTGPTEDSFVPEGEIKRRLVLEERPPDPVFETPFPDQHDFTYWTNRMAERRDQVAETSELSPQHVEIHLPDEPTLLSFIGDIHAGHACDYERVYAEVEHIVNTPGSYVMLAGDLIDGLFFNPGQFEQIEQVPQQIQYLRALVRELGARNKLLVSWSGDHDGWIEKMGATAYGEFQEMGSGYLLRGVGIVDLYVGEQKYVLVGGHRFPGFSMYNHSHSQMRMSKFGIQGADIYFSGHTHRKGIAQQAINTVDGGQLATYVSVGPYKPGDGWLSKMGYPEQATDELFGASVFLSNEGKHVDTSWNILEAHEQFINWRSTI